MLPKSIQKNNKPKNWQKNMDNEMITVFENKGSILKMSLSYSSSFTFFRTSSERWIILFVIQIKIVVVFFK